MLKSLKLFKVFLLHELQELQLLLSFSQQLHLLLITYLIITAVIKEISVYTIAATISSAVPPKANARTIKIEKNIPATLKGQFIKLSSIADKIMTASGTSSKSSVRTIYKAEVIKNEDRIYIELTGNGFLYNMVRIISGTLLDVGIGKIRPEEIKGIIEAKERKGAGKTLPAHGLCLMEVTY